MNFIYNRVTFTVLHIEPLECVWHIFRCEYHPSVHFSKAECTSANTQILNPIGEMTLNYRICHGNRNEIVSGTCTFLLGTLF